MKTTNSSSEKEDALSDSAEGVINSTTSAADKHKDDVFTIRVKQIHLRNQFEDECSMYLDRLKLAICAFNLSNESQILIPEDSLSFIYPHSYALQNNKEADKLIEKYNTLQKLRIILYSYKPASEQIVNFKREFEKSDIQKTIRSHREDSEIMQLLYNVGVLLSGLFFGIGFYRAYVTKGSWLFWKSNGEIFADKINELIENNINYFPIEERRNHAIQKFAAECSIYLNRLQYQINIFNFSHETQINFSKQYGYCYLRQPANSEATPPKETNSMEKESEATSSQSTNSMEKESETIPSKATNTAKKENKYESAKKLVKKYNTMQILRYQLQSIETAHQRLIDFKREFNDKKTIIQSHRDTGATRFVSHSETIFSTLFFGLGLIRAYALKGSISFWKSTGDIFTGAVNREICKNEELFNEEENKETSSQNSSFSSLS